jgi:hypothetical protein
MLYCVLQSLCYNLTNMHKLTPKIQEVVSFSKWLSVKQNLRSGMKSVLYSHIWTLGTNTSHAQEFLIIFILVEHAIRNNLSFGSGD